MNRPKNTLGDQITIGIIYLLVILVIGWITYWGVTPETWKTILKVISIAFVAYGFFFPLRAILAILLKRYIPCFPRSVNLIVGFISGIFVGCICPIGLIITYVICNVIGLVTSED